MVRRIGFLRALLGMGCFDLLRLNRIRERCARSLGAENPLQCGRNNKSLDASGTSALVIDNLSVAWLSPAASTQPLGFFLYGLETICSARGGFRDRCRRRVGWARAGSASRSRQ